MSDFRHVPVLLAEVIAALSPRDGGLYVDGTFGGGGYSRAVLAAPGTRVFAIDRDGDAIQAGVRDAAASGGRLMLVRGQFGAMDALLAANGFAQADGVMLDIGISSHQIDTAERGFSFLQDGPLDMRMGGEGPSAADLVNTLDEEALANLIYAYGEERRSRAIARAIAKARAGAAITRTLELAQIVARAAPGAGPIHPATRTFQALRIAVNDELGELTRGLTAAERVLCADGRLAVVTFHSLEDRIVKEFLAERAGRVPGASRHLPEAVRSRAPSFELLSKKPIVPGDAEIARNPRARSAKLRAARRTSAPAFPAAEPPFRLVQEEVTR